MKPELTGKLFTFLLTLLLALSAAPATYAHGSLITYIVSETGEVELHATFDSGEPIAEAQITIFAPDDSETPWLTTEADAQGHFVFSVDPAKPGTWEVQFRKAGHGDTIYLNIQPLAEESGVAAPAQPRLVVSSGSNLSGGSGNFQMALIGGSFIWGFIGTALYISGRRSHNAHS